MVENSNAPRERFIIPARSAKAFRVNAGERLRIIDVEGAQVADFNVYAADDPREHFSAGATRRLHGVFLKKGDGLWSNPGRDRMLMRIVEDTVSHRPGRRGARAHCILFPRCTRYVYEYWSGDKNHPNCQDQLAAALKEFGLGPDDTHDTVNFFQKVGVEEDGALFIEEPDARSGDYVELEALVKCLANISACPADAAGGVIPAAVNNGVPKPLAIEIYAP
jgi:uncharacterized protein YcgI (DUF1989 family)